MDILVKKWYNKYSTIPKRKERQMAGYKTLFKQMGCKCFNKMASRLAYEYATCDMPRTYKSFAEVEGISEKCFKKLLEHAVIHHLVEDKMVDKMEEKASWNMREYNSTARMVASHYRDLRYKRKRFVYNVARDFCKEEGMPIEPLLKRYMIDMQELRRFLDLAREEPEKYGTEKLLADIQHRIFFDQMPELGL